MVITFNSAKIIGSHVTMKQKEMVRKMMSDDDVFHE